MNGCMAATAFYMLAYYILTSNSKGLQLAYYGIARIRHMTFLQVSNDFVTYIALIGESAWAHLDAVRCPESCT